MPPCGHTPLAKPCVARKIGCGVDQALLRIGARPIPAFRANQLSGDDRLREHRLPAPRLRRRPVQGRSPGAAKTAELLKLTPYLDRTPLSFPAASSSGQRWPAPSSRMPAWFCSTSRSPISTTSCARNCARNCRRSSPEAGTIFVYATTEPHEALLLGGNTATLSEGRVTQFGPTLEVFRKPVDLVTARTFADPPLNTIELQTSGRALPSRWRHEAARAGRTADISDIGYTIGFQPHHLFLERPNAAAVPLRAKVAITEITGSESFVHLGAGRRALGHARPRHPRPAGRRRDRGVRRSAPYRGVRPERPCDRPAETDGLRGAGNGTHRRQPYPPLLPAGPCQRGRLRAEGGAAELRAMAAPTRCWGRPAAARPRCSTSSPGCSIPRMAACCSTAAT